MCKWSFTFWHSYLILLVCPVNFISRRFFILILFSYKNTDWKWIALISLLLRRLKSVYWTFNNIKLRCQKELFWGKIFYQFTFFNVIWNKNLVRPSMTRTNRSHWIILGDSECVSNYSQIKTCLWTGSKEGDYSVMIYFHTRI